MKSYKTMLLKTIQAQYAAVDSPALSTQMQAIADATMALPADGNADFTSVINLLNCYCQAEPCDLDWAIISQFFFLYQQFINLLDTTVRPGVNVRVSQRHEQAMKKFVLEDDQYHYVSHLVDTLPTPVLNEIKTTLLNKFIRLSAQPILQMPLMTEGSLIMDVDLSSFDNPLAKALVTLQRYMDDNEHHLFFNALYTYLGAHGSKQVFLALNENLCAIRSRLTLPQQIAVIRVLIGSSSNALLEFMTGLQQDFGSDMNLNIKTAIVSLAKNTMDFNLKTCVAVIDKCMAILIALYPNLPDEYKHEITEFLIPFGHIRKKLAAEHRPIITDALDLIPATNGFYANPDPAALDHLLTVPFAENSNAFESVNSMGLILRAVPKTYREKFMTYFCDMLKQPSIGANHAIHAVYALNFLVEKHTLNPAHEALIDAAIYFYVSTNKPQMNLLLCQLVKKISARLISQHPVDYLVTDLLARLTAEDSSEYANRHKIIDLLDLLILLQEKKFYPEVCEKALQYYAQHYDPGLKSFQLLMKVFHCANVTIKQQILMTYLQHASSQVQEASQWHRDNASFGRLHKSLAKTVCEWLVSNPNDLSAHYRFEMLKDFLPMCDLACRLPLINRMQGIGIDTKKIILTLYVKALNKQDLENKNNYKLFTRRLAPVFEERIMAYMPNRISI